MSEMTYSADSTTVRAFVEAYEENRNLATARSQRPDGWQGYRIIAEDRRKYVAIDETDRPGWRDEDGCIPHRGGRFLVDRQTGTVYTIRGYGQRGGWVGQIEAMTEQFREASASYNVDAGYHWEDSRTRLATT